MYGYVEGERTGLLILRVNIDPGSAHHLRIHIRRTADIARGFEHPSSVTEIEDAVEAVRSWLTTLAVRGGGAPS